MARTRNAVKRQKVATVESALFNPDVVFLLAALLDARDLCQVSLTCKTLGGKTGQCRRRHVDGRGGGEAAVRLVGANILHGEERSNIRTIPGQCNGSSAFCSNHVMRSGKHFAIFTGRGSFGVVRPVQIELSDFGEGALNDFSPGMRIFWEYLIDQRTDRWTDSNVHCCSVSVIVNSVLGIDISSWYDWTGDHPITLVHGFQFDNQIGLLLDLDEGTLSIYQDQKLATLKDGLSGEYCWFAAVGDTTSISIERGLAPGRPASRMKGGRNKEGFVSIVRGLEEANKSSVSQGGERRKLNSYIGRLVRVKSQRCGGRWQPRTVVELK
ncbi:hypothetical protein THAOC_09474 [Thalassiosira oceanica]|uniref:F-box domain-containing protein n=1 Tax=Thalassiosira oceanica TaxID=159749 RepID=K0SWD8_THAOC|nr:hypothetical protein THAOC_09474 [Thalassiosira oceanica]|eukprot:EJK69279.1 hypothetical protein THAOC_09474 [Thalassiosira oceanica]